jgi:hypothetical protein
VIILGSPRSRGLAGGSLAERRSLPAGRNSDRISTVSTIQIESAEAPFTSPGVVFQAMTMLGRADAMGLLPPDERIDALDLPSFRRVLGYIHLAGIARAIQLNLIEDGGRSSARLERALEQINTALEESPAPEFEWNHLGEVLGVDLLSRLVGVSISSIRRYSAAARTTPDSIADRLHYLSLIVGDLSGAYNEIGIRQWFLRSRAQLGGHAPSDLLRGDWKTTQPAPKQVQALARALMASPAT